MQFQMELIVYTQDTTYSQMLAKRKREDEEEAVKFVNNNSSGATLKEMLKHLKSYYQVNVTETLFFMFAFKNMI